MFYTSCLTYCSTSLARLVVPFLLFDLLLHVQCGVLLFLFNLLLYFSCSTCCSTPLVQLFALLFLFDLLFYSCCSTYYFAPLVRPFAQVPFFYTHDFLVFFVQRCYSCSSCFSLVFSPIYFFASMECGGVVQI